MGKEDMSREEVVEKWKGILTLSQLNTHAYVGMGVDEKYEKHGCIEGDFTQVLAMEKEGTLNMICPGLGANGECSIARTACTVKEQQDIVVRSLVEVFKLTYGEKEKSNIFLNKRYPAFAE